MTRNEKSGVETSSGGEQTELAEAAHSLSIRPRAFPYAIALASVGLAFAARLAAAPVLGERQPFAAFYLAVVVSSWWGLRAGLVAVGLGLAAGVLGLMGRPYVAADGVGAVTFAFVGLVLAYAIASVGRARPLQSWRPAEPARAASRASQQDVQLPAMLKQVGASEAGLTGLVVKMNGLLPKLCRLARVLVDADGATFVLREGSHVCYAAEDAIAPLWAGQRFPIDRCISGWSIKANETTVIEDVYADPRIPTDAYRPTFVTSLAMVPVRTEGGVLGAMGAYWAKPHRASDREVELLEEFVSAAADSIAIATLYADSQMARHAAEKVAESARSEQKISEVMRAELPLDELLNAVLVRVQEALRTDAAIILTCNPTSEASRGEDEVLWVRAALGTDDDGALGFTVSPGPWLCRRVAKERRTIIWDNIEPQRSALPFLRRKGVRALAAVPLVSRGRLRGVLEVACVHPRHFSESEVTLLETAAERIAVTIERTVKRDAERRVRESLEASNRAKDEFLAMLGHELRNPLAAMRSAVAAATLDESQRAKALEIARRQTEQLGRLIDDLLDVARVMQGRIVLRKGRVRLTEVMERGLESTRSFIESRGVKLNISLESDSFELEADATRLEQVLVNLLSNAAKYTEPGGQIDIKVVGVEDDIQIHIRDTGIGIAPDMLPHIWDLFATATRAPERSGGLGIGLTVARRLVELHGGTIEARSEGLGRGAEFVLRIPGLLPPLVAPAEPETAIPAKFARVLLVEDNPDAAESLKMLLESLGHRVRVAYEGVAALETLRAEARPDVMLVDIGLPGLNGYEVAQRVRQDRKVQKLILVALTGYGREEDKQRAMAAGFDYHLVKPVNPDMLHQLLAQFGGSAAERPALQ